MIRSQDIRMALALTLSALASMAGNEFVLGAQPIVLTNSIGMNLVEIPAGEFMMGAEEDHAATLNRFSYCDPKWLEAESPRHKVRITKPFLMGQYEVTLDQFLKFYHDAKYKVEIERDGKASAGYGAGTQSRMPSESNRYRPWAPLAWKPEMDHPVIYVSWNDAVAFCEWLSKKEGKKYRLPTEAEWEYACRAGSGSEYHFGDDPEELVRFANIADTDRKALFSNEILVAYDKDTKDTNRAIPFPFVLRNDGYAWTAPVGKFRPNAFGLYDMHGNTWEWCSDWHGKDYYSKSPADDPQGPSVGASRVLRGGSFSDLPVDLRCASRTALVPSDRNFNSGFRVVSERSSQ